MIGNSVQCSPGELGPGGTFNGSLTFNAGVGGIIPLELNLTSDGCDSNNADNKLPVPVQVTCPPEKACFAGLGRDGGGVRTEIWLANPTQHDIDFTLFATDADGQASTGPLGGNGLVNDTLPSGTSRLFATQGDPDEADFIVFLAISDSPGLIGEFRQFRAFVEPAPRFLGSTEPLLQIDESDFLDAEYPIPFFNIVGGGGRKITLVNLADTPQPTTGVFRDATTGVNSIQFNTNLNPFQIQTLDVDDIGLPGGASYGFWKTAGRGVLSALILDEPSTYQNLQPIILPSDLDDSDRPAQPIYQPDPADVEYDPSELEMFIFPLNGDVLDPGTVSVKVKNLCDVPKDLEEDFPFSAAPANSATSLPIDIDDSLGGFADADIFQDGFESGSTLIWKEGDSKVVIKAKPPAKGGNVVHIPKKAAADAPAGRAETRLMIRSEADRRLPVAAYDANGNLLNFKYLDVPKGSHLYCVDDVSSADELDYLQFHVSPDLKTENIWIDALADEPDLEYKDQLPLHRVEESRVGEFTKVLEAWNGNGGTSCLGDAPDILDIVRFMNDGLKCP